jgi:hypothetical protein
MSRRGPPRGRARRRALHSPRGREQLVEVGHLAGVVAPCAADRTAALDEEGRPLRHVLHPAELVHNLEAAHRIAVPGRHPLCRIARLVLDADRVEPGAGPRADPVRLRPKMMANFGRYVQATALSAPSGLTWPHTCPADGDDARVAHPATRPVQPRAAHRNQACLPTRNAMRHGLRRCGLRETLIAPPHRETPGTRAQPRTRARLPRSSRTEAGCSGRGPASKRYVSRANPVICRRLELPPLRTPRFCPAEAASHLFKSRTNQKGRKRVAKASPVRVRAG